MSTPGTLAWFARHELRLAWRDWAAMLTAGRSSRAWAAAMAFIAFAAFMHGLAFTTVARFAGITEPDKTTLVVVTGVALMSWSLMLSQAMESVTRALYARSDLDLILSSPVYARKLFSVRIGVVALTVASMAVLLGAPFLNVLAFLGGPHWLGGYAVFAAMGATAAALALVLTVLMFRTIGPRRTRFIAQVIAAIVGAAFVIGVQAAAVVSYGTLSRLSLLQSEAFIRRTPDEASPVWWPARAILGDSTALAVVVVTGLVLLIGATALLSRRFGDHVITAAGTSSAVTRPGASRPGFRPASPGQALRRKEWTLLRRDPWLVSQTLMQLLYLLPPALLLWRTFADGIGALVLLIPVLVMAAGQLAGGLAWLAISGEDAPDLIATAPVADRVVVAAKVEAVMGCMALVFAPFAVALLFISPVHALAAATFIAVAAYSATRIQLWFRAQAKRSQFRRRHTSSRLATYAEAFSSIAWASTAALTAAGTWLAAIPAVGALVVLWLAWLISPRGG